MTAAFASEKITTDVETEEHRCKVFQIVFHKKDGSLFVSFPYYRDALGPVRARLSTDGTESNIGEDIITLECGVKALRAVYDELDVGIREVRS